MDSKINSDRAFSSHWAVLSALPLPSLCSEWCSRWHRVGLKGDKNDWATQGFRWEKSHSHPICSSCFCFSLGCCLMVIHLSLLSPLFPTTALSNPLFLCGSWCPPCHPFFVFPHREGFNRVLVLPSSIERSLQGCLKTMHFSDQIFFWKSVTLRHSCTELEGTSLLMGPAAASALQRGVCDPALDLAAHPPKASPCYKWTPGSTEMIQYLSNVSLST